MKILSVVVLSFVMLTVMACGLPFRFNQGFQSIQGSGKIVSEDRPVNGFNKVVFSGVGNLTITQTGQETLKITGDDNIISHITARVTGNTLEIGMEPTFAFNGTQTIQIDLTVKDLSSVELSGFGDIHNPALKSDDLTLRLSGAGSMQFDDLTAQKLNVQLTGAGSAAVKGQVDSQTVRISGAGNYNAADLQSSTAVVDVTGLGNATVWATDTLNASISGSGNIQYYGSPTVSQNITGIGKVTGKGAH